MKTVIEMAREAGLAKYGNGLREGIYPFMESIERFAELIRADAIADEREAFTPGFAGVTLWLGGARVTQIVTEAEIKYEREQGQALTHAAQKCLDIYAGARGPKEQP